jgi:hypothetical protein
MIAKHDWSVRTVRALTVMTVRGEFLSWTVAFSGFGWKVLCKTILLKEEDLSYCVSCLAIDNSRPKYEFRIKSGLAYDQ